MYSSRMRTARLLTVSCSIPCILGGLPNPRPPPPPPTAEADPHPLRQTPAPLEADPPPLKVDPPTLETDSPHLGGRTPPGHVTCDACWKANPPPPPPHTHVCENIILPKTSFVGGKDYLIFILLPSHLFIAILLDLDTDTTLLRYQLLRRKVLFTRNEIHYM